MRRIKRRIRKWIIDPAAKTIQNIRTRIRYRGLTTQDVFSKIYEEGAWGKSDNPTQPFFSGSGSHDSSIVSVYVQNIIEFLANQPNKLNAVDLGCGDFSVGSQIRPLCNRYVACDIVPKLIEFNKQKFAELDVEFKILDLITETPPDGDIVFIRQVLQHLSNAQIQEVIPKLVREFKFLVLTEHLPATFTFPHNMEKPTGPDIRVDRGGGVVLTSPPFNLIAKDERILCEVSEFGGVIRTTLYRLQD